MANYKRGIVIAGDICEQHHALVRGWQLGATLESFSYDYARPMNHADQSFGAHIPATLEFSFRLAEEIQAFVLWYHVNDKERTKFSFVFDPQMEDSDKGGDFIVNYNDGIVADGYVVHIEEEFHSAKDSDGRECQTILHVKLLLRSVSHIRLKWENESDDAKFKQKVAEFAVYKKGNKYLLPETLLKTYFVNDKNAQFTQADSRLRLHLYAGDRLMTDVARPAFSKTTTCTIKESQELIFTVTLQSLSFTKAVNKPHVVRARLLFYAKEKVKEFPTPKYLNELFLNRRAELLANKNTVIFDDYYVREVMPSYSDDGNLYLDLTICSPDYLLTIEKSCRSFVGMKLSDIVTDLLSGYFKPYDLTTSLDSAVITEYQKHFGQNSQEHIFPYLVQYNESIYDFLLRTANRWGEFLYYDGGRLNIGFYSNIYNSDTVELATPGDERKDGVKYCHAISYVDPASDHSPVQSVSNYSMEAAQEFLTDILTKGEYEEPVIEKYKLGKAFTSNKHLPSWAADNLIADLIAFGQAKRYTDALREQFNKDYFDEPKAGIPQKYDEQYNRQDENNPTYREFTDNDPSAFQTFDTDTYKTILVNELSRGRHTIVLDFDTEYPDLALGRVFKLGEDGTDYYVVTEVNAQYQGSQLNYQVKAIQSMGIREADQSPIFYPPYLPSGHTRKAGPLKAVVADADDPLRMNRVRVRFEWQKDMGDPTPWLMVAQDGMTAGAGSHVRHYPGEQVLVGFIGGNVERPYVIGSLSGELPRKDSWDSPAGVVFKTPYGQSLRLSDGTKEGLQTFHTMMDPVLQTMQRITPNFSTLTAQPLNDPAAYAGNMEIRDRHHTYDIKCSTNERQISISSPWGDVEINAFTGINFTAPDGDVRISGNNVTVEAGNNLRLVSGTSLDRGDGYQRNGQEDKAIIAHYEQMTRPVPMVAAKEAAARALLAFDEKGAIDLTMLRHIRDMFVKPVEGVLEVQSNRYLKLESDGASTGYPAAEYKDMKVADAKDMVEGDWYLMGEPVAHLIEASWAVFVRNYKAYCRLFSAAQKQNDMFESKVLELKFLSEAEDELNELTDNTTICHLYKDLKDKLSDSSTKELTDNDLGFNDELVGVETGSVTEKTEVRVRNDHAIVVSFREEARADVVTYANKLLAAIQDIKANKFDAATISNIKHLVGTDDERFLPTNYMDAVKQAYSQDNCTSLSEIYKTLTTLDEVDLSADTYKNLADPKNEDTRKKLTALKHLITLNLLEQLGFKMKKDEQKVTVSALVTSEDDLMDDKWKETAGYLVYEYNSDDYQEEYRKSKVREKDVWSNAKSGQVLISSGEPYVLGKETKRMERRQQGELKTERLVKTLSKHIKRAMGIGAADNLGLDSNLIILDDESIEKVDANLSSVSVVPRKESNLEQKEKQEKQEEKQEDAKEEKDVKENKEVKEEEEAEAENKSYYQLGDIISYNRRLYVCVSKHQLNETARFITVNDQYSHYPNDKKYEWDGIGRDAVLYDDMASAETICQWVVNLLLDDDECEHLRKALSGVMEDKNGWTPLRALCPEDDDIRGEYIESLFSMHHFITDAYKPMKNLIDNEADPEKEILPITGFEWGDRAASDGVDFLQVLAPTGFLLADKTILKNDGKDGCWVPYILLVSEDEYNDSVKPHLDEADSQNDDCFKWEDLGTYQYNGKLDFYGSKTPFHVLKLAVHWCHEDIQSTDDFGNEVKCRLLQSWKQNWRDHPNSEMAAQFYRIENTWTARNMTSREYLFIDEGVEKKVYDDKFEEMKSINIWVKNDPNLNFYLDNMIIEDRIEENIATWEELQPESLYVEKEMELPDIIDEDEFVENKAISYREEDEKVFEGHFDHWYSPVLYEEDENEEEWADGMTDQENQEE